MMLPVDLYRVKHDSRDAVKTTRVKAEAKDFEDRGRRQGLSRPRPKTRTFRCFGQTEKYDKTIPRILAAFIKAASHH